MRDWKLVLEVYPSKGSRHFCEYACGAAAFYIRAAAQDRALHVATSQLSAEGWSVARIISSRVARLDAREPDHEPILRDLGLGLHVCNLNRVRRLVIDGSGELLEVPDTFLDQFVASARHGLYVLMASDSTAPEMYIAEGTEVIPMWTTLEGARRCNTRQSFPNRAVRFLEPGLIKDLVSNINSEALLGLGLHDGTLVTFHPEAFLDSFNDGTIIVSR